METPLMCPRCDGEMEEGFVVDYAHAMTMQQRWVPGLPKTKFMGLGGVKSDNAVLVATWRCLRCGRLESFATQTVD